MDSLKIGELAARPGKSPAPLQPVAQTAAFGDELNVARPGPGLAGRMSAMPNLAPDAAITARLTAPIPINVTLLPSAAAGYGSARAAFGVDSD